MIYTTKIHVYIKYNSIKNSKNPGDQDTAAILKRRINTIATSRGFKIY